MRNLLKNSIALLILLSVFSYSYADSTNVLAPQSNICLRFLPDPNVNGPVDEFDAISNNFNSCACNQYQLCNIPRTFYFLFNDNPGCGVSQTYFSYIIIDLSDGSTHSSANNEVWCTGSPLSPGSSTWSYATSVASGNDYTYRNTAITLPVGGGPYLVRYATQPYLLPVPLPPTKDNSLGVECVFKSCTIPKPLTVPNFLFSSNYQGGCGTQNICFSTNYVASGLTSGTENWLDVNMTIYNNTTGTNVIVPIFNSTNPNSTTFNGGQIHCQNFTPGNYSVELEIDNDCGEGKKTINFIIPSTLPISITASPPNICGNQNTTLTATPSNYASYSWARNGVPITGSTASISVNQGGTYTVSATNNGCTGTASVVVNQNSAFTVNLNVSQPNCDNNVGSIVAVPSISGQTYTYQWSNGSTNNGILNISPGTYSVTVRSGGCSAVASATIVNNGLVGFKTVGSGVGIPNVTAALIHPSQPLLPLTGTINALNTSQKIFVVGTFEFDVPYTFFGTSLSKSEVVADQGALINIRNLGLPSGQFTLNAIHTNFRGCTHLWRGIYTLPQTPPSTTIPSCQLRMQNCTISDAEFGINAGYRSVLSLESNTFKNNFVGIMISPDMQNSPFLAKVQFVQFTRNNFTSDQLFGTPVNLRPRFSGFGSWLNFQCNTNKAWAGIHAMRLTQPIIFNNDQNTFSYLGAGVVAENATFTINNFVMFNIQPVPFISGNANALKNGIGIYASHKISANSTIVTPIPNTLNHSLNCTGNASTLGRMTNCKNGIWAEGINVNLQRLNINNSETGVRVALAKTKNIIIGENVLSCINNGINLYQNDPVNQSNIFRNNITLSGNGNGAAILQSYQNTVPLSGFEFITANKCTLNSGLYSGIAVTGGYHTNVVSNEVRLNNPTLNFSGIYFTSGSGNIECNTITGTNRTTPNNFTANKPMGIDVINSIVGVRGNRTDKTRHGVCFTDNCFWSTVNTNSMGEHTNGLFLSNSAVIPNQIHAGNIWTTSYDPNVNQRSARFDGFSTANSFNRFLVNSDNFSAFPSFWPANNAIEPIQGQPTGSGFQPNNSAWFSWQGATLNIGPCVATSPLPDSSEFGAYRSQVYNEELEFEPEYQDPMQWKAEENLYTRYKEDPSLVEAFSTEEAFVAAKDAENIGKFYEVEKEKTEALSYSQSAKVIYNQLLMVSDSLLKNMTIHQQVLDESEDEVAKAYALTALENLKNQYAQNENLLATMSENMESEKWVELSAINTKNSQIVPNPLILELNKKVVNDIFINTVAKNNDNFNTQQEQYLEMIANQCPIIGGKAVHEARSLLAKYDFRFYNDDSLCAIAGILYKTQSKKAKPIQEEVKVYPNPTSGSVNVVLPTSDKNDKHSIAIHSIEGKELVTTEMGLYQNTARLQVGHLANGIYFVHIYRNGELISQTKLSLLK